MIEQTPLQFLLGTALDEVKADSHHRLAPQRRRQIYDIFLRSADSAMKRVSGWLAVLAAKRALPVFERAFPDDGLPREILDAAVGVLQGSVDDARAAEIEDEGYHAAGNAWGYDELDEVTWPAALAADASYHALKEARGFQPLNHLEHYYKVGSVTSPFQDDEVFSPEPEPIKGDTWLDEDICQVGDTDTAAAAAVALSCREDGPVCDPEKLQVFWMWWLVEAVPTAIEAARLGHLPTNN
ncbi:MAG: hypothetical protein JXA14_05705 [Anaerolineae bacterium]|nr:hypothetical protein [Anaerolineae bacterium]